MKFRNAVENEHGTIDCEFLHDQLGWIPFTASPNDVEEHGRDLFHAIKSEE